VRVERHVKRHERIGRPSNADIDGTMTEVRLARFRDGVVVCIHDTTQITGDVFGDGVEFVEVMSARLWRRSAERARRDYFRLFRRGNSAR
jgi:hypothetical protein